MKKTWLLHQKFWTPAVLILAAGILAACGNSSGNSSETAPAQAAATQAAAETAGAGTDEALTLKIGITAPTGSFQFDVLTTLDENLQEVSGDSMKLEIAAGGVLGNTASHYSQMAQGTLDLFCTGFDTASALKNGTDFQVVMVPFLFDDLDHYKKFLGSEVLTEMLDSVEEVNGLKFAGVVSDQAPRALTTTNTPVRTVADVKNLKIRCPESPSIVGVWTALGANPMIVSGGELFSALQSGQVDGQDNDLINSYTSSFSEVQKYFMPLDYIYSDLIIWMSQKTYDKLSEEQRGFYEEAVEKTYEQMSDKVWNELYADCEQAFQDEGVTIVEVDKTGFLEVASKYAEEQDGTMWKEGLYQKIRDLAD